MKRITIVTDAWHPQINGVITTLDNLIARLEERGIVVTIIHPGLFTRHIPLPSYPEIRLALCSVRRMRALLRDSAPDAIHLVTEGTLGMSARKACLREGFAFTSAYHTQFPLYVAARVPFFSTFVSAALYAWLRSFHGAAALTMVPTESIRADLAQRGFRHLSIWAGGVDTDLFKPARCAIDSVTRPCFVYFGRVAPEKNIEEFLKLPLPGSKMVIGDGPARADLERRYGTDIRFVGYKRGQELVDTLACADVAVFPSRTETFGLTIVEALACGIPVAAHDASGSRDIITPEVDGVLDADLGRAALRCLTLSREACREKALQYSWDKVADAFLQNVRPIRV